ncbi:hypothetical protein H7X69_01225 [Candidatus Saccharibacteria bacterium]|nr:hypothetical protein [Candidatus Saccharibacteria bacterium]
MEKLYKKIAQQKITEVRRELARAHLIITLLSAAVIMMLIQGATLAIRLDPTLSAAGIMMLGFVAVTSLIMSFALFSTKKK